MKKNCRNVTGNDAQPAANNPRKLKYLD